MNCLGSKRRKTWAWNPLGTCRWLSWWALPPRGKKRRRTQRSPKPQGDGRDGDLGQKKVGRKKVERCTGHLPERPRASNHREARRRHGERGGGRQSPAGLSPRRLRAGSDRPRHRPGRPEPAPKPQAGLLAPGSTFASTLPRAETSAGAETSRPSGESEARPQLQWRGPRRIRTGFPIKPVGA